MLARRHKSQLLIVDVQQKLAPSVHDHVPVVANCARLIGYARSLGVPVTVSEHYPAGLGATVGDLSDILGSSAVRREKITFSCWRDVALRERFEDLRREGRTEVVVAGMEAHVCVGQTVHDLLANGFDVFVVADAVSSRSPQTRELALYRMQQSGAAIVGHEMIAFEWLERADVPEFRDVLKLLK